MTTSNTVRLRTTKLVVGLTMLCGCASAPPPVQELEVATAAVDSARASGAPEHAADQWRVAEGKLAAATKLLKKNQHVAARRALQQATADANLAAAMVQLRKRDTEHRALQLEFDRLQQRIDEIKQSL